MENSISIPSSHLKYLIPGYKQRLLEIDEIIKELDQERKEISEIISTVDADSLVDVPSSTINDTTASSIYDKGASWFVKAKFVLKKAGKPLTTAQIVDEILIYEPNIANRLLAVRNISSILGVKSKEGKEIERFKIEGKDQKFGLK